MGRPMDLKAEHIVIRADVVHGPAMVAAGNRYHFNALFREPENPVLIA